MCALICKPARSCSKCCAAVHKCPLHCVILTTKVSIVVIVVVVRPMMTDIPKFRE
jgi:hypothetical protein